ncbi:MAG: chorismate mutase [Rhodospirillales bacterium]|jgi:chorismate mutase|nr:chorismate mutase [Rhodospirillales bacterium]
MTDHHTEPTACATGEAAAARSLAAVRSDIDAVDRAIHDLIIRRMELVKEVRVIKHDWPVKIQPSREAEILYRLVERHRGPFPRRDLCAIWRQLITATISFEGPFSVAVFGPDDEAGCWDVARDHFGPFVAMTRFSTVRSVIEAVRKQDCVVGVLPMPRLGEADPWWRVLVTPHKEAPRVIGRLPFVPGGNGRYSGNDALMICPVPVVPTGRDRTYLAVEADERLPLDQFSQALAKCDFTVVAAAACQEDQRPAAWFCLAEVEGYVDDADPRLAGLAKVLPVALKQSIRLGGYARPLEIAALTPEADVAPPQ